ncbi:MAG: phytoene/squalene synthase family protein, partial [Alphaproteobacteria bacterium]
MTPPNPPDRARPAALSGTARQVRRLDYDRYLTLPFAPAEAREDLAALYAFNIEIAKTRETVSEALLGQIRLQWWRESIESAFAGTPRRHEIVRPLADAIRRHDLPRAHFDALIDARERDLAAEPPPTLATLEDYAFDTSSRLILLALAICGVRGDAADRAAHHVG